MKMETFTVKVYFDGEELGLVYLPNFSRWFTDHQLNPSVEEHIFVSSNNEDFDEESEVAGSSEWYISKKFYEPDSNTIFIYCKDAIN